MIIGLIIIRLIIIILVDNSLLSFIND